MLTLLYAQIAVGPISLFPALQGVLFSGPGQGGSAGSLPNGTNPLPNPLGISTVGELIDKVTGALTLLAIPIVTAMVLWGAFKIATSAGDPKQVSEGGAIIKWAAIGFCLLLVAGGVTKIVQSLFT